MDMMILKNCVQQLDPTDSSAQSSLIQKCLRTEFLPNSVRVKNSVRKNKHSIGKAKGMRIFASVPLSRKHGGWRCVLEIVLRNL